MRDDCQPLQLLCFLLQMHFYCLSLSVLACLLACQSGAVHAQNACSTAEQPGLATTALQLCMGQ